MLLEIQGIDMTNHAGHGHRAMTPRRREGIVEVVILDVFVARYRALMAVNIIGDHGHDF